MRTLRSSPGTAKKRPSGEKAGLSAPCGTGLRLDFGLNDAKSQTMGEFVPRSYATLTSHRPSGEIATLDHRCPLSSVRAPGEDGVLQTLIPSSPAEKTDSPSG